MSAHIWRVEVTPSGTGYALIGLRVDARSWMLDVCEADDVARRVSGIESAMRAVEVAVLREARIACGSNYGEASIDRMIYARLPDCACATDPASETHSQGTRQHP